MEELNSLTSRFVCLFDKQTRHNDDKKLVCSSLRDNHMEMMLIEKGMICENERLKSNFNVLFGKLLQIRERLVCRQDNK